MESQNRRFTLAMSDAGLEVSLSVRLLPARSQAFAPLAGLNGAETSDACCLAFARSAPSLVPQVIALHQQVLADAYAALRQTAAGTPVDGSSSDRSSKNYSRDDIAMAVAS